MTYPFADDSHGDPEADLVTRAQEGGRLALESLIRHHQHWIYNIALRMCGDAWDAEDVTQEVMIKIITKLSTFRGQSRFRTWVYRITANHVLNMKKSAYEKKMVSFSQYARDIDMAPDLDLPDEGQCPVDISLIVEEVKIHCFMGMYLCLNRRHRLVFILGELLEVGDVAGSEILEISRENYRKMLSRARQKVYGFMRGKCSLVKENNSCRCHAKARSMIDSGAIDPARLQFARPGTRPLSSLLSEKYKGIHHRLNHTCRQVLKDQPFLETADFVARFRELLGRNEFRDMLDFNPLSQ